MNAVRITVVSVGALIAGTALPALAYRLTVNADTAPHAGTIPHAAAGPADVPAVPSCDADGYDTEPTLPTEQVAILRQ